MEVGLDLDLKPPTTTALKHLQPSCFTAMFFEAATLYILFLEQEVMHTNFTVDGVGDFFVPHNASTHARPLLDGHIFSVSVGLVWLLVVLCRSNTAGKFVRYICGLCDSNKGKLVEQDEEFKFQILLPVGSYRRLSGGGSDTDLFLVWLKTYYTKKGIFSFWMDLLQGAGFLTLFSIYIVLEFIAFQPMNISWSISVIGVITFYAYNIQSYFFICQAAEELKNKYESLTIVCVVWLFSIPALLLRHVVTTTNSFRHEVPVTVRLKHKPEQSQN